MSTARNLRRRATFLVCVAAIGLAMGACSSGGGIAKDQVAAQVGTALQKAGVNADAGSVTCPQDLSPQAGQTIRCQFTVNGQPVDAVPTVTVNGADIGFTLATEARAISKGQLQRDVAAQLVAQGGTPVELIACTGDLQPKVDQTANCTVTRSGVATVYSVRITEVDGGKIEYGIDAT